MALTSIKEIKTIHRIEARLSRYPMEYKLPSTTPHFLAKVFKQSEGVLNTL